MRRALVALALALPLASTAAWSVEFSFDVTGELVASDDGSVTLAVHSPYRPLELVPGVVGNALRLDGYSTWLHGPGGDALLGDAFTIELWVAVAHYPVETAALVTRASFPEAGIHLGLNPWGRLVASIATDEGLATAIHDTALAKNRWHHVALTLDRATGLRLILDGELVASAKTLAPYRPATDAPLVVGRNPDAGLWRDTFEQGVFNGVIDALTIHDDVVAVETLRSRAESAAPAGQAPTAVPNDRFADDPARPAYHPMPAAGWTNEPHGLIHDGERFRLFYQANPNGPFWSRIRWGQLTSPDLVHWSQAEPALVPEPGFDQAGIWVGNTFLDEKGDLHASYTGVNGVKAGIGMAAGRGGSALEKSPGNPVIPDAPPGFKDFRDSFVWRRDGSWSMLVGSGREPPNERGVALLYRSDDLAEWDLVGTLNTGMAMVEGAYWEVPTLIPLESGRHALFVTTVERNELARGLYWLGDLKDTAFRADTALPRAFDVFHRMLSPTFGRTTDGRLVAIGIVPGTQSLQTRRARGWAHTFSLPREVRPCPAAGLCQAPLRGLTTLRGEHVAINAAPLADAHHTLTLGAVPGDQAELRLEIDPGNATELVVDVLATPDGNERSTLRLWPRVGRAELDLSRASGTDDVGRTRFEGRMTPLAAGETLTLRAFVDHSVVDVFLGETEAFSFRAFPTAANATHVRLSAHAGEARLLGGDVWAMQASPIGGEP